MSKPRFLIYIVTTHKPSNSRLGNNSKAFLKRVAFTTLCDWSDYERKGKFFADRKDGMNT